MTSMHSGLNALKSKPGIAAMNMLCRQRRCWLPSLACEAHENTFEYPAKALHDSWILMCLNMDRNTLWGSAGGMVFVKRAIMGCAGPV